MAIVTVGTPIFSGGPDEDVRRHVELFTGYIHGLGINPADGAGGPPNGEQRTLGLFRASLSGDAGKWFDETFLGKHWELYNLYDNHGQANLAGIAGRNMGQLIASNSFRVGTDAHAYATVAGNVNTTLRNSTMLPAHGIIQDWAPLGGRPTDEAPRLTGAGGAVTTILPEIRIGNVVYWFLNNYTTVQRARREAKFGDLVQGDMPIDVYYKEIRDTGRLLEYPAQLIENQFFRGLNDENLLEVDRQGDKPLGELVESLKKIEKRKAEMKLGMHRRNIRSDPNVIPVQAPPVVSAQEPTILKPVTSHAITQDALDRLLNQHTENLAKNFQAQLQALQNTIAQPSVAQLQKKVPPPIPPKDHRQIHEFYESQNPFDDEYDRQYNRQQLFDEITKNDREALEYANIFAKASAKAKKDKMERKVNRLANMMGNLNLEDDGRMPMDVDITDGTILQDADGNEFTVYLTRGSKKK